MNPISPSASPQAASSQEPLWLTSAFSSKDIEGKRVLIEWMRDGKVAHCGVYRIHVGTYGHSRHIQRIRGVLEEGVGCNVAVFDFDQADADLMHRSNEAPKAYELVAKLDCTRQREQNPDLERLVRERKQRKAKDVEGADHWETAAQPVLKSVPQATEGYALPRNPDATLP